MISRRREGRRKEEKREKLMSFYWEPDHSSLCIVLWMQIGCNFIKGTLLRITYDRASIGPQPLPLSPHLPPLSSSFSILFTLDKRYCAARNTVICDFSGPHVANYNVLGKLIHESWIHWLAGLDRVVELSMVIDRGERFCRFFINFQSIRVIIYLIFA